MPNYAYKAMNSAGQSSAGTLPAPSRAAVMDQLTKQGLIPVSVNEMQADAPVIKPKQKSVGHVSHSVSEAFIRELSNLLAGGVSLSRALQILSRESSNVAAKQQWSAIHDDVMGGSSLAEAMGKWPRSFSAVQLAMVKAGETGGFLDVVLEQIADFRARERDLKSKVKGAMVYPAVLAVISCGVVIFLLTYFIPRFSGIFSQFKGAQLPALTQFIIAASGAMTHYGLFVAAAVIGIVIATQRALKSEGGRRLVERILLRTPALGMVLSRFALVRFCRMLGTLLGAGVPLIASLKVAREALGNQTLSDAVNVSIDEVQQGVALSKSLGACPMLFPASITEVIAVAEESGRLDKELIRLASMNETELDRRLRVLVALAEPLMLFIMAGLVGTIVIGMLLPVFTLQQYIK